MKILVEIAEDKMESFLKSLKSHSHMKAKRLFAPIAAVLDELNYIKKAFKLADKVKAGKIKKPSGIRIIE